MKRKSMLCWAVLFTATLLPNGGCGSTAQPADPDRASTILHAALDAWKAGEKPDALTRRDLPIQIQDLDWARGLRLVSYQASAEGRPSGFDRSFPVLLELQGSNGKRVKKHAVYVVSTAPQSLVFREDG